MRWENLRAAAEPAAQPLPLALPGAVARTFDTPEFRGMTFYEVRAKSIINRVPSASRVPFEWTVNPYRGCTHACVYCLDGGTPVLMADGRPKPLADLHVGDRIYGTEQAGAHRRYMVTEVLAQWRTVRPAYRLGLADGTTLVGSGDHRLLSRRGWAPVTDLTAGDTLLGTGAFAAQPHESTGYRRGYLCGLLRGGTLAHADAEATQRAKQYLADLDVRSPDLDLPTVRRLVTWPRRPEADWTKGFLAGLFDAEGSYRQGVLSIVDPSPGTVDRTVRAMHALGFAVSIDVVRDRPKPPRVRLRGGLAEHLRFFQTVDPAVTGKRSMAGATVDSRVPVLTVEPLGVELPMVDITTGTGDFVANGIVSHNCFARNTHSYLDLDTGHDFDTRIVVKVNAGALLRRELAAPRWSGAPIAMGTNVDCYQRAEGRYRLMRDVLAALRDFANPYSILTKGTLILRDLDLLTQSAEVTSVGLAMSIGFVDEALWRSVEPGTPSPRRRLDAVRQLSDAGFAVGVLMAPVLPGLTDDARSVDRTVAAIAAAGAASVTPLALHLRPGAREWYLGWLARTRPELLPRYRGLYGGGSYLGQAYQRELSARVRLAARRHGLGTSDANTAREVGSPAPAEPQQLTLL